MKNLIPYFLFVSIYSLQAQNLPVSTIPSNQKIVLETICSTSEGYSPTGHYIADSLYQNYNGKVTWVNFASNSFAPLQNSFDFRTNGGNEFEAWVNPMAFPTGTVQRTKPYYLNDTIIDMDRRKWKGKIDSLILQPSLVNIAMNSEIDVSTRILTVNVEIYYTQQQASGITHLLNVGMLQDHIEAPQINYLNANPSAILPNGNYLHKNVFRGYINNNGAWGDSIDASQSGVITKTFQYTIPQNINNIAVILENLKFYAFIHNGHNTFNNSEIFNVAASEINYLNAPYVNTCANSNLNASVNTVNASLNSCDGSASVNVTGGTGYHTYYWTFNNGYTSSINNLCSGVYNVIVTDSVGCSIAVSGYVHQVIDSNLVLNGYVVPTINSNDTVCDGQAYIIAYGGVQPYTYLYSNGSTSSTALNLCPGIHNVTIYDAAGHSINLDFATVFPQNYYNNIQQTDSTIIDSLYNGIITNCNINYSTIDSIYINSIEPLSYNTVLVNWVVNYNSTSTENISCVYTVLDNINGTYYFNLQLYCPNKTIGKLLLASDSYYVNGASLDVKTTLKDYSRIYPNPFQDFIEIELENEMQSIVTISDVLGKEIYSNNHNSKNIHVDLHNLVKGQYFLTISNKNGISIHKIIK